MNDELMTRKELAKYLRAEIGTIHNWEKQGLPVKLHVGRYPRYLLKDVEEWLKQRKDK